MVRHNNQLPDNLPQLQNLIKRDPESYKEEVNLIYLCVLFFCIRYILVSLLYYYTFIFLYSLYIIIFLYFVNEIWIPERNCDLLFICFNSPVSYKFKTYVGWALGLNTESIEFIISCIFSRRAMLLFLFYILLFIAVLVVLFIVYNFIIYNFNINII